MTRVLYAVKANPAREVLDRLAELGSSFDVASPGEIDRCLKLGIDPARLAFGNTIKKERDIAYAHSCGVGIFTVDAEAQLDKAIRQAPGATVYVRISTEGPGPTGRCPQVRVQSRGRPSAAPQGRARRARVRRVVSCRLPAARCHGLGSGAGRCRRAGADAEPGGLRGSGREPRRRAAVPVPGAGSRHLRLRPGHPAGTGFAPGAGLRRRGSGGARTLPGGRRRRNPDGGRADLPRPADDQTAGCTWTSACSTA